MGEARDVERTATAVLDAQLGGAGDVAQDDFDRDAVRGGLLFLMLSEPPDGKRIIRASACHQENDCANHLAQRERWALGRGCRWLRRNVSGGDGELGVEGGERTSGVGAGLQSDMPNPARM